MIIDFLFDLRGQGLKVGPTELLTLWEALGKGLHDHSLEGLYDVARALLVHRESDLDAFDRAFSARFKGTALASLTFVKELDEWLRDPAKLEFLSDEARAKLQELDIETLRKMFQERLAEQRDRHEGGNRMIGSGGTSPFGTGGVNPAGVRVGGGGGRSAIAVADARRFKDYRTDVVLDVRSIEVALRKLRGLTREGAEDELDLEATVAETARQAGELEIVLRAPRKSNVRVVLLMDVGGTMDPYSDLVSKLFSAAKRASHFRALEAYYFHNAIYGYVYEDAAFHRKIRVPDLLSRCDPSWKCVMVGDASMHPAELLGGGWDISRTDGNLTGLRWFQMIGEHFRKKAWLNPEPKKWWTGTVEPIGKAFPMFELTLDGLSDAVTQLTKGR